MRTQATGHSELITWKTDEVPAAQQEPRTPEWYDTFGWIQVTEFASWKEVVDWGLATFSLNDPTSQKLGEKIAEIAKAHVSPEDRALAVIDFVQNDVRYFGIEMGANSYKPTPASLVFEHRFGDCKDKTQLCVAMLRALGVEAYPALVNTSRGAQTDQLLPSPLAFDHAIVQLTVEGRLYWIDATRSSQCGRLQDFDVDDFKRALLLKPGADALVSMQVSPASTPQVAVDEIFTVKSMTDPVSLLIHTVFKGRFAEMFRATFKNSGHEKIEKAYLNYYAKDYTKIDVENPLRFQDFPDSNRFEVWQDYTICNLWTRDTPTSPWKAGFTAYSIVDAIGKTTSAQRTTPYHLDYPNDISENLEIQFFDHWHIDTTPIQINTANFAFTENSAVNNHTIHFNYHYRTLAADVLPANIGYYNQQIDKVRQRLQHGFTFLPGMELGSPGIYRPNWIGFIIFGLVLGLSGYGAKRIYSIRRSHDPSAIPSSFVRYEGISGWLILVLLGLFAGIFVECKMASFGLDVILNLTKWNALTVFGSPRYEPSWGPALLFESSGSVVLLVSSILALILLIQKRFTFPKVMILLLFGKLAFRLVDHAFASQVTALAGQDSLFSQTLASILIACAIWIPYFLVSKRVKATFRY